MNGRSKVSAIIGAVVMVATIVIFAISRPVIFPATILGFCFLLYSELVLFGGFIFVENLTKKWSEMLTRIGIGIPILIYAIVVFLTSLIYINIHISLVRGFIILQILLFVAVAIIIAIMIGFLISEKSKDIKVLQANSIIGSFADELRLIREQTDKKFEIDKLIESIKFTDTSIIVDADVELKNAISNLENIIKSEKVNEIIFEQEVKNIEFLIKKRNLQTKKVKQGSI